MALVTLDEVKRYLNISGTDEDSLLQDLINEAEAWVKKYCGRDLEETDYDEIYDGTGDSFLVLNQYPVNQVSELYIDTNREFNSNSLIDSDDYGYYTHGAIRLFAATFPNVPKCVRVKYTAGYATIPDDLKLAVKRLVAFLYDRRSPDISREHLGSIIIEYVYGDDLLHKVLEHYRVRDVR